MVVNKVTRICLFDVHGIEKGKQLVKIVDSIQVYCYVMFPLY